MKTTRTQIYLKVVVELPESDEPEKLGAELCRLLSKVYGVEKAEVTGMVAE